MVDTLKDFIDPIEIYKIIVDNVNELVSIIEKDHPFRIEFVNNQTFSRFLNYSDGELVSKSFLDLLHPQDKDKIEKKLIKGFEGILELEEIRLKHKNQKYISFELKARKIKDHENRIKILLILRDKTKNKKLETKVKDYENKIKNLVSSIPEIRFWKLFYPKKYEEALKLSYEMLQTVIDNIPENIFWKDTNLVYLGCNQNYAELIDAQIPENVIGKKDEELLFNKGLHQTKIEQIEEKESKIIELNKPEYHVVESWIFNDDKKIWLDTNRIPLHDSEGNIVGLLVTYDDITEIKKGEEKLKESEQKFRTISERSLMGILILQDDLIKYVNQRASQTLGYSIEEMKSWKKNKFLKLFVPEDRELVLKMAREIELEQRENRGNIQIRCIKKTGEILWIELFAKSFNFQGEPAVLVTAVDITKRKKAEDKLIESEEKYRHLFESSPNMICLIDGNRKIIDFNSALIRFFDRKRNELLGKYFTEVYQFSEDELLLLDEKFKELFKKGYIKPLELEIIKDDNKAAWLNVQASFVETGLQTLIEIIMEDITDRKLSEEILQLNEARLNALFKLSLMGDSTEKEIAQYAVEKAIELTNSKFGGLFFINQGELYLKHFSHIDFSDFSEDFNANYRSLNEIICWRELLNERKPQINNNYTGSIALLVDHPQSNDIISRFLIIPILDEDQVVAIACLFNKKSNYSEIDIHQITSFMDGVWKNIQRKRAREALRESEKKYRDLLETSSMGILVYDMRANDFTYVNPKLLKMLGYEKKKDFKKNDLIKRIYHADLKKFFRLLDKEIIEFRIYDKIGNLKWLSSRLINQYNEKGEVTSFRVWVEDVTEKKMFEELIYELNINFLSYTPDIQQNIERLLETCQKLLNSDVVIYVHRRFHEGKEIYYLMDSNKEVQALSPDELNNKLFINELFMENHDYVQTIFDINETKYAQTDPYIINYKAKGCYGKLIKSQNEFNSALCVFYDKNPIISHQDKFVLFLVGDAIEIEQRRWQVQQHLEEQNKLKTDLLSRTSHELKTPLISIKGFTELLLTIHKSNLDSDVISILEEIKEGSNRLERLVNSLLKSSRLDQGRFKLNITTEDLSFLIKFCVKELQGLAELRNQKINLNIHEYLTCNLDKERVYEVMTNILLNAIKYTPPGGNITIKTDIKEKFYIICVKDNGIGITEEEKSQLFKQFGKIERYGKGWDVDIEGSGLGLYISKKIIELHGGKIWVESEGRNEGSIFCFSLPIISK
ncbi:MAG: PAS domain S-box protein [Promethearchaeota archaeon]|nr:MAG: PAS domain S-box protein [Candidatus Lokiarchaeota archaeon]